MQPVTCPFVLLQGFMASLELVPMWTGVDHDVEVFGSGVVREPAYLCCVVGCLGLAFVTSCRRWLRTKATSPQWPQRPPLQQLGAPRQRVAVQRVGRGLALLALALYSTGLAWLPHAGAGSDQLADAAAQGGMRLYLSQVL